MKSNLVTIITKFKEKFTNPKAEFNLNAIIALAMILGLIAFLAQFRKATDNQKITESPPESIDIFIPEGQTLIPIQVANHESLDQIIGAYGVVDLYSTPLNPKEKSRRIAYKVKLIRSSGNSDHFSVLLPADEAHRITGYPGAFHVSVRNPKAAGTQFVKEKPKKTKRTVIFESE